jgi:hypothetical protein
VFHGKVFVAFIIGGSFAEQLAGAVIVGAKSGRRGAIKNPTNCRVSPNCR